GGGGGSPKCSPGRTGRGGPGGGRASPALFGGSGAPPSPRRPPRGPPPPIWAGGSPGALSAPAMRRAALLCDAWHPLNLGWADLERGVATVRELAAGAGRRDKGGFAPRNGLALGAAGGGGRAPVPGPAAGASAARRRA